MIPELLGEVGGGGVKPTPPGPNRVKVYVVSE